MARGVNKVILIGNLGSDPETRYLPSGGAVTNVNLATSETWKDKQTGQNQERTEWHKVVFFNRLAEVVGEYASKGSKLYVEGSLRTRKYQDKQTGQDRFTTEIVASEMQLLDGKQDGGQGGGYQQQGGGYQQNSAPQGGYQQNGAPQGGYQQNNQQPRQQQYQQNNQQPSPMAPQGQPNPGPMGGFDNSFDDDIPF